MKDDGEAGQALAYFFENIETKLGVLAGLEFICAVRGTDRDREGIDSRSLRKLFHFVGRREQRVVRFYFYVVLYARELAELRFDDHAVVVCVLDDFFRERDILLPRFGRSVDHDGSESAVDRGLADIEIRAVIEVHDDGNIRSLHRRLHEMFEVDGIRVLSRTRGNLKNDGRFALVRRLHDRLNHLHVVDVERADGITARIRFLEHFGTGN